MKRKLCLVVASEMTIRTLLAGQLAALQAHYEVTVVVNTANPRLLQELGIAARLVSLPIERHVSPFRDLDCLIRLIRFLRAERFDLVQSMTPKAGLLAMVAAWLVRVPVRVHTFTGQVWATRRGPRRAALRWLDNVVAKAATFTLADSPSQREFLASERVVSSSKIAVLGRGSVSGVDTARFRPDSSARRLVREALGIPPMAVVLLFIGRINRDKGVLDLVRAFATLADRQPEIRLLLVGPDEQRLRPAVGLLCGHHQDRLHFCDYTNAPESFMAASDILCLPSYREGFGSVVIEGAATGLPAVASRIYGVVDAVVDGTTGLLHEPGDVEGLVNHLDRLAGHPELRRWLGDAARERAERDFRQSTLTSAILDVYARLLDGPPPREGARLPEPPSFQRPPELPFRESGECVK